MKPTQQKQAAPVRGATQSQEIVKHQHGPLVEQVPKYLQKPDGQPRAGFEEFEQGDVKLPRLGLCQALTPQRSDGDPQYIDGLKEGDIFNNVTQINYGRSAKIVPLLYFKMRFLFKPMDQGGGILCRSNDCKTGIGEPGGACLICPLAQFGTARNGEGKGTACLLIYNFPVLVANEEGRFTADSLAILSLKSTGIPEAQKWITLMRLRKTDMFAGVFNLTARFRNEGSLKWWQPVIENAGFIPESMKSDAELVYQAMRELRDQGRLKPDLESIEAESNDANEEKPPF